MSRFIDKLDRVRRGQPEPIGFRASKSASPRPRIQLVAGFTQEHGDQLAGAVTGADAALLRITRLSPGLKTLEKTAETVPDIPWGGWRKNSGAGEMAQIAKAGGDFMVFPAAGTPLVTAQKSEIGKIIEVEISLGDGLLRAINRLPVDAVLIAGQDAGDYSLTWEDLIRFRRFTDALSKPLLVTIPDTAGSDELQALWEAGVSGLVVELKADTPPDRLKELRQAIDRLDFPSPEKGEKPQARLTGFGGGLGMVNPEEEPDEEEEDE